jgi:Skp family chaperone for outer membrane proteins
MKTGSALIGFVLRCSVVTCIGISLSLVVAAAAYGQKPPKIGVKTEEGKFLARQKAFESKASKLSAAERQNQTDALERESVAIKRLIQDKTEKFRKEEADNVSELSRQITPVIKAFAAEKGYTVILEARRPGLLYYDKNLDLTAEIVKRFDQASK